MALRLSFTMNVDAADEAEPDVFPEDEVSVALASTTPCSAPVRTRPEPASHTHTPRLDDCQSSVPPSPATSSWHPPQSCPRSELSYVRANGTAAASGGMPDVVWLDRG